MRFLANSPDVYNPSFFTVKKPFKKNLKKVLDCALRAHLILCIVIQNDTCVNQRDGSVVDAKQVNRRTVPMIDHVIDKTHPQKEVLQ